MVKKLIAIILCVIFIGLIGCGKKETSPYAEMTPEELKEELARRLFGFEEENVNLKLEILSDHQYFLKGGYIYIEGSVKNTGESTISYFEVVCKFYDDDGQVLDSTYTNDGLDLEPGEMRKFEIRHKYDIRFKDYRLFVGDVR